MRMYDRAGRPIDMDDYIRLMERDGYRVVRHTQFPKSDVLVSTVWIGHDMGFHADGGAPVIFETMVFGSTLSGLQERHSTEAEAREAHKRIVASLPESIRQEEPEVTEGVTNPLMDGWL